MGTVMTAMGGFTPEAFRVAWLVQYPVWLVAVIGVLVMRRKVRGLVREPEQAVRGVPQQLRPAGRLRDQVLDQFEERTVIDPLLGTQERPVGWSVLESSRDMSTGSGSC
jgi:hypothetical protein